MFYQKKIKKVVNFCKLKLSNCKFLLLASRRHHLKGHPLQVRHKQDWGQKFILLLPQVAVLLYQMLAVMLLSQHRILSPKTVIFDAPCDAQCMRHAIRMSSAVCSVTLHSKFDEKARPHLCMAK